jgi:hypothetical protein
MNRWMNSLRLERWPLPRVLIFMLAGAFAGLVGDLRVEHVEVVHERSIAWLPILYSAAMAAACFGASVFWNANSRRILIVLFSLALFVGGIGFYLHNDGHIVRVLVRSLSAWTNPGMTHPDAPPQMAPMAFCGLGLIGILVCLRRYNAPGPISAQSAVPEAVPVRTAVHF